jgi:hypothetical protein
MPKLVQRMLVLYTSYDLDPILQSNLMTPSSQITKIIQNVAAVKKVNGYVPVSLIEYDEKKDVLGNLENAYKLHQNGIVTDSWTLSPPDGLTAIVDPIKTPGGDMGHRSMMIGDIVEFGGNQYVVATFGFMNVGSGEFVR